MMLAAVATVAAVLVSCHSHYEVTDIQRTRVLVDKRYDAAPDPQVAEFMQPFKHQVDSVMSPIVGRAAIDMAAKKPESTLSNLLCDILVWGGKNYNESPDFSVYNMGGIRAALSAGNVTYGDVLEVAPFENKICFLTLTGTKVMELFSQIAAVGGEGVSKGVQLVITTDRKLVSARINGEPVDPDRKYRIATLDYLAQGNDGMEAFKAKTDVVSPQEDSNNVRFIIMDYFREQAAQGNAVSAKVEGRIVRNDPGQAEAGSLTR